MLPDTIELLMQKAAENTIMIPFGMWRDVFIDDGDPDLVQRAYAQLSAEPFEPGPSVGNGEVSFASDFP